MINILQGLGERLGSLVRRYLIWLCRFLELNWRGLEGFWEKRNWERLRGGLQEGLGRIWEK